MNGAPLAIVKRINPREVVLVFKVHGGDHVFRMDLDTARGLNMAIAGVISGQGTEAQVTSDPALRNNRNVFSR